MIVTRQRILKINPVFSGHLSQVQKTKYEPIDVWVAGEEIYIDNTDETIVLSKEQAKKYNEEAQQFYQDHADSYEIRETNAWSGRVTIKSPKKDVKAYLTHIGKLIAKLSLQHGKLMVLGDWDTPWLHQENDYPQLVRVFSYLKQYIDNRFNGGFILKPAEISNFIPHLFWLIRCNASLPEILMGFENGKTIYSICRYGMLHIEFYDLDEKEEVLRFYRKNEFAEVEECCDPIKFDC